MDLLQLAFESPKTTAAPETPRGLPKSVIRYSSSPLSRTFSSDSSKSKSPRSPNSPASVGSKVIQKGKKSKNERLGSPRLTESLSPKVSISPISIDKEELMREYKSFHKEMNASRKDEDNFDFYSGNYENFDSMAGTHDSIASTNSAFQNTDEFPSVSPTNHSMVIEYAKYLGFDMEQDSFLSQRSWDHVTSQGIDNLAF